MFPHNGIHLTVTCEFHVGAQLNEYDINNIKKCVENRYVIKTAKKKNKITVYIKYFIY